MSPDKRQVEQILSKYHDRFAEAIRLGWDDWKNTLIRGTPVPVTSARSRCSRSGMVWDCITRHFRPYVERDSRIRLVEKNNTSYYIIEDAVVVRFKKGDRNGMSNNVKTQPDELFPYHNHALTLFDLPRLPRVEVIYLLNEIETEVTSIFVVAREERRCLWRYEIPLNKTATVKFPAQEAASTSRVRIRASKSVPKLGVDTP